jgi:hypothetical protein
VVLPQLPIDGAAVAAIDGGPVLERPQLVIRVVMRVGIVNEGEETLDQVVWMVVLAQGKKGVWTVTLLRRCGAGATNTNGVALAWDRRHDLLDADLVAPRDVEMVMHAVVDVVRDTLGDDFTWIHLDVRVLVDTGYLRVYHARTDGR